MVHSTSGSSNIDAIMRQWITTFLAQFDEMYNAGLLQKVNGLTYFGKHYFRRSYVFTF